MSIAARIRRSTFTKLFVGITSVILFAGQTVMGAVYFLDTSSGTAGLLGGTVTWDAGTTAAWTTDLTGAALNTTYASGSDVIFNTTSAPTLTIAGTVAANSLNFVASQAATISGGTLTLGGAAASDRASPPTGPLRPPSVRS